MIQTAREILNLLPFSTEVRDDITARYPDKMSPEERYVYETFAWETYEEIVCTTREGLVQEYLVEHAVADYRDLTPEAWTAINAKLDIETNKLLSEYKNVDELEALRAKMQSELGIVTSS